MRHFKRIVLVAGARPNFMKVGPLCKALKRLNSFEISFVHTGQHYDANMSQSFLRDLGLPKPAAFLEVGSGTHAEQTAKAMVSFEKVCARIMPDLVVVVGDVNPTMACAVTAKKLGIPVAHVEAGLRSRDMSMPEEINRILTDSICDYLFTPSQDADANLLKEGIPGSKIYFTGNVMIDSLVSVIQKARRLGTPGKFDLQAGDYGLITLHRPSNVDDVGKLSQICDKLLGISKEIPLVFPVHPRTLKNLGKSTKLADLRSYPEFKLVAPLPYLEFLDLMVNAKFVLTDSGGIQEETTYLGIPCLTLRDNTERPITVSKGTNELTGVKDLTDKVRRVLKGKWKKGKKPRYWDGKTANRIAGIIQKWVITRRV